MIFSLNGSDLDSTTSIFRAVQVEKRSIFHDFTCGVAF